jgi:hypothetical protein
MTESVPLFPCTTLELDEEGSRPRHVLDGKLVQAGTVLEIQPAHGGWHPMRYEARWVDNDGVRGRAGLFKRWHLVGATGGGRAGLESHDLPPGTVLRQPKR